VSRDTRGEQEKSGETYIVMGILIPGERRIGVWELCWDQKRQTGKDKKALSIQGDELQNQPTDAGGLKK